LNRNGNQPSRVDLVAIWQARMAARWLFCASAKVKLSLVAALGRMWRKMMIFL
jgi:hypothetical protein